MELKPYQHKVIKDLEQFLTYTQKEETPKKAFDQYWEDKLGMPYTPQLDGSFSGMTPYKDNIPNAVHIAIKVPTAGGKTFIAVNALHTINKNFNQGNTKAVVWLVPWSNLLQQTVNNLSNPNHPYREKLNSLFGNRVEVYEKDQLLQGANFNPTSVTEQLNIFVFNFSSLRINSRKKEDRKVFQENGALESFRNTIVDKDLVIPDTDETALINVIRSLNPIVIVDESHNAESDLSVEMLNNLNPSLVLDLTATPKENSNIVSYVNALALKKENMVKLPVVVYNHHKKEEVITSALHLQRQLELIANVEEQETGKYIRPIILFQAQSNIKGKNNTTFQKIKEKLVALKIPEEQIKIKTSGIDELKGIDLMSKNCPVRYIITVNALKEGWDNPNVFQICTLNQTVSITKKRQEIGRGLRLAVNQKGERLHDDQINILTVVANESYESFANTLQQEYIENEGDAPPKPKPKRAPAKRQDKYYTSTEFKDFWTKLTLKSKYTINVDSDKLLAEIKEKFKDKKNNTFPVPKVVISKGNFVITTFTFRIKSFEEDNKALISIVKEDTRGNKNNLGGNLFDGGLEISEGDDLEKILKEKQLRGFKVNSIEPNKSNPDIEFKNGFKVSKFRTETYEVTDNRDLKAKDSQTGLQTFPVFNVIDKLEKATSLTKNTCFKILKAVPHDEQGKLFRNPEGFTNKLIEITKNALAIHVAENIEFETSKESMQHDVEELFPKKINYVQTEIVDSEKHGLYDKSQKDSDIEDHFVTAKLEGDDNVQFFFKFPSKYKIDFPKIIGNYNPDWGVIRHDQEGIKVQLVRETKGTADIEKLRFVHEINKVKVAHKHFTALGIDYDVIKGDEPTWYLKKTSKPNDKTLL